MRMFRQQRLSAPLTRITLGRSSRQPCCRIQCPNKNIFAHIVVNLTDGWNHTVQYSRRKRLSALNKVASRPSARFCYTFSRLWRSIDPVEFFAACSRRTHAFRWANTLSYFASVQAQQTLAFSMYLTRPPSCRERGCNLNYFACNIRETA